MRIKTSELSGIALDYAVAVAERFSVTKSEKCDSTYYVHVIGKHFDHKYKPHSDWAIAGPIIARKKIEWKWESRGQIDECFATSSVPKNKMALSGSTELEACMRFCAALELGDEVDVPDDLAETAGKWWMQLLCLSLDANEIDAYCYLQKKQNYE
jgi:hypothetical protein